MHLNSVYGYGYAIAFGYIPHTERLVLTSAVVDQGIKVDALYIFAVDKTSLQQAHERT